MSRRRRQPHLGANPFVVLADVTIALSFIFLLYSVYALGSTAKSIRDFDRNQRQAAVVNDLITALDNTDLPRFQHLTARAWDPITGLIPIFSDRYPSRPVVKVYQNASYQRISIDAPLFESDDALTAGGKKVYAGLGNAIRDEFFADYAKSEPFGISYVYFHGTYETPGSTAGKESRKTAKQAEERSTSRAQEVLEYLQSPAAACIQTPQEALAFKRLNDQGATAAAASLFQRQRKIDLRYAIAYGTGDKLYTDLTPTRSRVDILLFYEDKANNASE